MAGFTSSIREIASATGGQFSGPVEMLDVPVAGVVTDSREVRSGNVFIARCGEETDGHRFIEPAISAGAGLVIVSAAWDATPESKALKAKQAKTCFVTVDDPTLALGALARAWREKLGIPTLAVTGSNGKTTAKEMIRHLLSSLVGKGTANLKSFNNHVGLPQTILSASADDRWLLLEAGMNHAGELTYLGGIAKPDLAVLLNIGPVHMEFFDSLDAIADSKCELLANVKPTGSVVLNADDAYVRSGVERLETSRAKPFNKVWFSCSAESAQFKASNVKLAPGGGTTFELGAGKETIQVLIPHSGAHHVYNALAAVAAVKTVFPSLSISDIGRALESAPSAAMRFEKVSLGAFTVINDAYNANPVSMAASIRTVAAMCGKGKFSLVIGDMFELGELAEKHHRDIGTLAAELGCARLVALGQFAEALVDAARQGGLTESVVAAGVDQAVDCLLTDMPPNAKTILIKASRGMALERVVTKLTERVNALPSSFSAK